MSGVQGDRIPGRQAARRAGPQNLSCEMRGMPRQRPNKKASFVIYETGGPLALSVRCRSYADARQALRLWTFQRRTTLDKDSCSALLAGMSVKPSRITRSDRA